MIEEVLLSLRPGLLYLPSSLRLNFATLFLSPLRSVGIFLLKFVIDLLLELHKQIAFVLFSLPQLSGTLQALDCGELGRFIENLEVGWD